MLCGTAFNEDESIGRPLPCSGSTLEDVVIVWYYDVEAVKVEKAATGKTTEAQEAEIVLFASAIASGEQNPGPCPESLEWPCVIEIRT